ncbi:MAG: TOMM precursor leader peptide-binding protein [Bacteroidota bacterium]
MDSDKTLYINPNYAMKQVDEGLFFLSELEQQTLSGKAFAQVAPYLDGQHSSNEIVEKILAEDKFAPLAEIYYVLEIMKQKGYLIQDESLISDPTIAYWDRFPRQDDPALPEIERTVKITDLSQNPETARALRKSLREMGISLRKKAALEIVVVENYLDRRLLEINRKNRAKGQVWLPFKPSGQVLYFGPVFNQTEDGPCFACLRKRLSANREVETFIMDRDPEAPYIPTASAISSAPLRISANLAALEISRFFALGGSHPLLADKLLTYSMLHQQTQHHHLVKRPQCPVCGDPAAHAEKPQPPVLQSVTKRFTQDGGHRTATPEETFQRYEHHISPVTGIVNNLSRITESEDMIHSYFAGHNTAARYRDLLSLKSGLRSKAGGKGKSDIQARVSGLCEAIERYSGLYEGYEKTVLASYRDLGDAAIHPNACMNFSEYQYSIREKWNQFTGGFQTIPEAFDPDLVTEWSPVWSLTENRYKYLPTAYLYFSYGKKKDQFFTWADSNGNASGNTLEEAILQGFFELVERDAVALWWYNRLARPGVNLASFQDDWMQNLVARYADLNREIWALDLTSDFGIPVFAGISRRTDKNVEDIIVGFGAHFDARIALTRALTEVNQFIPAVMHVKAEGEPDYRFDDPAMLYWWKNATAANQPYILPASDQPEKVWSDFPQTFRNDIREDVLDCQARVESKGLEMLIMDQTRPDVGMPVAKVIVPGMRHFWARFGPGRLYDVPVQMGWRDTPIAEIDLNPIPMFI